MKPRGDLRTRLRTTTCEAHERLHVHPGFAAAAAGRVGPDDYCDMLARLYGFHKAFEAGFAAAPTDMAEAIELSTRTRSRHLQEDLVAFGLGAHIADLPLCPTPPRGPSEPQWLGALYVTEGSTLGGTEIGRTLERAGFPDNRRHFFTAYGERRSEMWRGFLARLETHADDPAAADAAEAAALDAFARFEAWMADWQGAATR